MPKYLLGYGFIILRVGGAALLFYLTCLFIKKEKIDWKTHGIRFLLCSIFGTAANMLLFFKGLEYTNPINGAVLMLATPIFVVILNSLLYKEKTSTKQKIGLLISLVGAILLMSHKNFQFTSKSFIGDLMITVNAMFYAIYLVLAKKLVKHYHPFIVSKYTFLIGFLLVIPFGYNELLMTNWNMPLDIVLKIIFIIVFTTFITYILNAWAIAKAGPNIVGSYIYLQPLLASIIAIYLGTDNLTLLKIISSILILLGVYLTTYKKQHEPS